MMQATHLTRETFALSVCELVSTYVNTLGLAVCLVTPSAFSVFMQQEV